LFTQAFALLATAVAKGQGIPDLPRIIFPHPLNDAPEPDIRAYVQERAAQIVAALVG
jgi:hypothetical protein